MVPPNCSELSRLAVAHLKLELDDDFSLVIGNDPTLELQPVVRLDLRRGHDSES
jgi:hypothetical protein